EAANKWLSAADRGSDTGGSILGRFIVSLRSRKQDAKAAARAGAKSARRQAQAGAKRARRQAHRAATQATPLAKSARETAQQSVHDARVWAAPRVERSGHAVAERIAPKLSDKLLATGRRLEAAPPTRPPRRPTPTPRPRRRRWPKALAGTVMLGVGTAVAAVLRSRRGPAFSAKPHDSGRPMMAATGPADSPPDTDSETADVNGQVRTP